MYSKFMIMGLGIVLGRYVFYFNKPTTPTEHIENGQSIKNNYSLQNKVLYDVNT